MARIINGILEGVNFTEVSVGIYTIENATYINQNDSAGNGTYDIQVGFIVFAPTMDAATANPLVGLVNRYQVTSVTVVDSAHVNLTVEYDGPGTQADPPSNGMTCIISEPSTSKKFGLPVSDSLYPSLAPGNTVSAFNEDIRKISDTVSSGGASDPWSALPDAGTSELYDYDVNGDIESVTTIVQGYSRVQTFTKNLAGDITSTIMTWNGLTRTETFTYVDGDITELAVTIV